MIFRQLFDSKSCTYTDLLASGPGREGVLIDPVLEHVDQYIQLVNELGLKLVHVIDTHVHADHVTGASSLRDKTQCRYMMGEHTQAEFVDTLIKEDEQLDLDGIKLKALYTPGHTDCSFCFLGDDRIFTGDTLLIRRTGRTDFQHGDAGALYDSLFNKLMHLPENTLVYPAHDYAGMTVSSIGEEKNYNPRLQVKDKTAFIDMMDNLNLPYTKMIDTALPANLKDGKTEHA